VPAPLVAVLLLVVGLLVALLEVSPGELVVFGAFVLVIGLVGALLRDFHQRGQIRVYQDCMSKLIDLFFIPIVHFRPSDEREA